MNPGLTIPASATAHLPAWALGISLLAHLALLFGVVMRLATPPGDLPPLSVSLRLPARLAPAPADSVPVARPAAPAAATRTAPARTAPAAATRGARALVLAASTAASEDPPGERGEAVPVPVLAAPEAGPAAAPVRAARAEPRRADAPDAEAMARYGRLLGDLLAQRQQYPRLAAARGWEGEVRLRLQVARKGTIIAISIVHSSGFEVLDQHAVQLVHSTPLPQPPASGDDSEFQIDIPIHYILKKNT